MLLSSSYCFYFFFFFKQKTAYEMRISDWSSDVCSSDLRTRAPLARRRRRPLRRHVCSSSCRKHLVDVGIEVIAVILAGHGQIFTLLGHADLGREIARENKMPEFLEKRCTVGDFPVHRRRQQRVLLLGCRLGARHLVVRHALRIEQGEGGGDRLALRSEEPPSE